ncbi:MAG: flagellar hook protein FlgE [Pseudomonas sp.]|nr:flagellar hook protein FlgE [Pseudomonas sp.]
MSFNIGLSGMRAASKDLNVTGNNIANAGTVGFKQSRAEFADVYAASILGTGKNQQGSGVLLSNVSQQFNQGNINYTENALDLAINGNGFFQVSNNGALSYTRAGYFGTDKQGFIVDNFGNNLQGYSTSSGELESGNVTNLQIKTTSQEPKPTSQFKQSFNLNSTNENPEVTPFDPADPKSYNSSTSTSIYDAQGNAHVMTQYFVKEGPNDWSMKTLIDGVNPQSSALNAPLETNLKFDTAGKLIGDGKVDLNGWVPVTVVGKPPVVTPNQAAASPTLKMDLSGATQYANSFAVNAVSQDGYTTGELAGIEIDDTGKIFARYTNGQSKIQGQVVLADFANPQGLIPVGKTQWVQSLASGEPVPNPGGTGTLGSIQAGALEESNVELSDQLVNLIVAQRNYQANAKTIETESAITQTIINLR